MTARAHPASRPATSGRPRPARRWRGCGPDPRGGGAPSRAGRAGREGTPGGAMGHVHGGASRGVGRRRQAGRGGPVQELGRVRPAAAARAATAPARRPAAGPGGAPPRRRQPAGRALGPRCSGPGAGRAEGATEPGHGAVQGGPGGRHGQPRCQRRVGAGDHRGHAHGRDRVPDRHREAVARPSRPPCRASTRRTAGCAAGTNSSVNARCRAPWPRPRASTARPNVHRRRLAAARTSRTRVVTTPSPTAATGACLRSGAAATAGEVPGGRERHAGGAHGEGAHVAPRTGMHRLDLPTRVCRRAGVRRALPAATLPPGRPFGSPAAPHLVKSR